MSRWRAPDLSGRVAVVTGSTRGIGRGIAEVLGACGATVYVTGRSSNQSGMTNEVGATVEEVAEAVERFGGIGKSVQCDHSDDEQVAELFREVQRDSNRLDILVNNVIGWGLELDEIENEGALEKMRAPMWERPLSNWDGNMTVGTRAHVVACREAIPVMLQRNTNGLIVFSSEPPSETPTSDLGSDVRAHAVARISLSLSSQLQPYGIASNVVVPGFPRTEIVTKKRREGHPYFDGWTDDEFVSRTQSVYFTGRGVAQLASDPFVMKQSGKLFLGSELATIYDFQDTE